MAARKEKMRRKSETRFTITQYFQRTRQTLGKLKTHSRRQTKLADYMEIRMPRQTQNSLQTVTEEDEELSAAEATCTPNMFYAGLSDLRIVAQCELRKTEFCNKNECGMT